MKRRTLALALVAVSSAATACIHVAAGSVATTSERAVIVWNPDTKMEHFIRAADFTTDAADIGFLVPTPSIPVLAAANPVIFATMGRIASNHRLPRPPGKETAAGGSAVQIISEQEVAGYKATVLKASDAGAAEAWLKQNGYPVRDDARKWLEPYVRDGWTITAFKIASEQKGVAELQPVAMSFKTDRPFYPYREPEQEVRGGRSLSVYLLSTSEFRRKGAGKEWLKTTAAGRLTNTELQEIRAVIGHMADGVTHLTAFIDHSSTRKGKGDLFFEEVPSLASSPLVWGGAALTAVAAAYLLARRRAA